MNSRKRPNRSARRAEAARRSGGAASTPPAIPAAVPRAPRKGRLIIAAAAAAVLLLALLLTGVPGTSSGTLTASAHPERGKALYEQYCVSCHSVDGRGERDWKYREHGAPALDDSGHAWHHDDAQLLSMILDKPIPDSRMPAWRGILSREDAIDLVAYIKSLWSPYIRANCQGARHMQCMGQS